MPESRTYTVTRVQRVTVTTNSHAEAQILGVAALDAEIVPDTIWGYVEGDSKAPTPARHHAFVEASTVSVTTERV